MKTYLIATVALLLPVSASASGLLDGGPVANWSGPYLGLNAGIAESGGRTDYSYSYLPGNGTGNFSDAFGNAADNSAASDANGPLNVGGLNAVQSAEAQGIIPKRLGSSHKSGFAGGGQIGFNQQSGGFVYGIEADIDDINAKSSRNFSGTSTVPDGYTNKGGTRSSVDWLGTARLRAGWAFDRALIYATGGLAVGGAKSSSGSQGTDGTTTDTFYGSKSDTRTGWTLGGGLEYALGDNWSGRIEGLYYNLGSDRYAVAPQDDASAAEGLTIGARTKFEGTLFRIALNRQL
jgi:outer membrane immunogenic protein